MGVYNSFRVCVHWKNVLKHEGHISTDRGSPETGKWGRRLRERSFPLLPLLTGRHSLSVGIGKTPRTEKSSSVLLSPTPRCSPVLAASPHIKCARRARSPTSRVAPASESLQSSLICQVSGTKGSVSPAESQSRRKTKMIFLIMY